MLISDWSSDVCSSDLRVTTPTRACLNRQAGSDWSIRAWSVTRTRFATSRKSGKRSREMPEPNQKTYSSLATPSAISRLGPSRRRSEEHTSELQSLMRISYAVFCLKKKNKHLNNYCKTSMIIQATLKNELTLIVYT